MTELKTRIEAKKKKLEAELLERKADAQGAASDAVRDTKEKLAELEKILSDGWDDLSDTVSQKLTKWLR